MTGNSKGGKVNTRVHIEPLTTMGKWGELPRQTFEKPGQVVRQKMKEENIYLRAPYPRW